MKLLKRAADKASKHLVLITTEAGLLPLAGAIGIYVAKSLQSKPEIPPTDRLATEADEIAEESVNMADTDQDKKLDKSKPIGEYAATGALAADDDQPIELDNTADGASKPPKGGKGKKKNKRLKVPDFNRFRLLILAGIVALIVIVLLSYLAFVVLPKASILIKTNSSTVNSNIALNLNTSASSLNATAGVIPAQSVQAQKTLTQQVNTTGQKNEGSTASGSLTMTAQECNVTNPFNVPSDVPAGAGVSINGLTFITQQDTSFTTKNAKPSGSNCYQYPSSSTTSINAQSAGSSYNVSNTSNWSVAGRSDVSASGSSSGGSDNVVQIVAQADITNAEQKLGSVDTTSVKQQLTSELQSKGLYAIQATFTSGTPSTTTSAGVGAQASTVTATQTVTYTMMGVKQSDLQQIVALSVDQQINTSKQSILDYGISSADYTVQGSATGSVLPVAMQDTSTVGSSLNLTSIKQQVAGKKTADATSIIETNPGVTNVTIHYSPFWVSSIPGKTSKITVTVEKPAASNGSQS